jgi:hypothetical protein
MERLEETCIYVNTCNDAINNCNTMKPPHHYDKAKALEESRRILALLNSPVSTKHMADHGSICLSTCFFCKTIMPMIADNQCKLCDEAFCGRHKMEINHNCEKLNKETAKYLNAKNQFKLRLREAKSKAVR